MTTDSRCSCAQLAGNHVPMAFFHIGTEFSLEVIFSIILLVARSVDGGNLYTVGGTYGWSFGSSYLENFQIWADLFNFTVTDALDFGPPSDNFQVMMMPSADAAQTCNTTGGTMILAGENNTSVIYNITAPGEYSFINPANDSYYCSKRLMNFTIVVFELPAQASQGPAPGPSSPVPVGRTQMQKEMRSHIASWIVGVGTGSAAIFLIILGFIVWVMYRSNARLAKHKIDISVLDRLPQKFNYRMLRAATKGFNFTEFLGSGAFGSVYKGKLFLKGDTTPTEVAVKRISATSKQGAEEFLAEVQIHGRLQHRNLVRLLGWCDRKDELLLVYGYMPNRSLADHLYKTTNSQPHGEVVLTWSRRLKIVSGVATALNFLHEEWEQRVIHRDVKSSNVMLDCDFNARLGDFGLARIYKHDEVPSGSIVLAGTHGYVAPELYRTLKATEKTDVYSFGVMVLEVATGKKPILSSKDRKTYENPLLVDWVWDLYRDDSLLDASDTRLQNAYDEDEMLMLLKIGLLCSHPNPDERPTMKEVINILNGSSPFPPLPQTKPVAVYSLVKDRGLEAVLGTGQSMPTQKWLSEILPAPDSHGKF